MKEIGRVREIFRYPVKSMAGEELTSASLGWHGVDGDRRMAFLRSGVRSSFPWLTASKLPSLITYKPLRRDGDALPSIVRTPSGAELDIYGDALRDELTNAHGTAVELVEFKNGIFDDAPVSIITMSAIAAVSNEAGVDADVRRFRPNILIEATSGSRFPDDEWVGKSLRFGDADEGPAVSVWMRDVRCVMINLDPDSGAQDPRMLKASVQLNENCAGVYATVTRTGTIAVGDAVFEVD